MALPQVDWLGACRRAAGSAREAVARFETTAERAVETGRGEGGDTALVIDRAAEAAILAEFEALELPLTVITEERGEVAFSGGGSIRVIVDPVDGSLNAKRGLPSACVSIAVASGPSMDDIEVGYVAELDRPREWWGRRRQGAWCDGQVLARLESGPLEMLGLDAMVSLREVRSVDAAAGQLLVREAGGAVAFPGGEGLDLGMRSRVLAARDPRLLEHLLSVF